MLPKSRYSHKINLCQDIRKLFMSDEKAEQPSVNNDRTRTSESVQVKDSGHQGERPQPTTHTVLGKRWHLRSSILLMLLGALAVTLYLLRARLAAEYEGIGAALCAVACGGFLVWHVIHLFAEQDRLEEQELNRNQAETSNPEPNLASLRMNRTTPPAGEGKK